VSHLYRCTLVTHAAPVALPAIQPRSCAATITNKNFLLHEASLTGKKARTIRDELQITGRQKSDSKRTSVHPVLQRFEDDFNGYAALISSLRTAQIQREIHVPLLNYSCPRVDYHPDAVRVLGEKRAGAKIGVSLNVRRNVRPKSVRRLMAVNDLSLPSLNVASTKPAPAMSRTCRSACRSRIRRKPCRCWSAATKSLCT
jgi:hypothetical protein